VGIDGVRVSLKLLRQYLRKKEQKELIDEIADLYKKFDSVKSYYQASVFDDDQPCRISVAKRAIADYKKLSCSDANLADIMLFYVECGVSFTNEYGDIDERLYNSMASVYVNACQFIHKNNLESRFQPRALAIVTDTSNSGWGFHEYLRDSYDDFFSDFDDN
jgi:O-methyltransferase involved in polyketide biosynthesis